MANMLRPIVILLLLVSLSPAARVAGAQPPTPASVEYRVKAALIYNFAKFVEWPDAVSAGDPFIIGVLGQDPFGAALDVLQGRTVSGKRVIVKRFETLDALERSDILFHQFVGTRQPGRYSRCRLGRCRLDRRRNGVVCRNGRRHWPRESTDHYPPPDQLRGKPEIWPADQLEAARTGENCREPPDQRREETVEGHGKLFLCLGKLSRAARSTT